ncbi:MAG: ATP-binding protein [Solobacterium sp.]|nr:ATP-binding protein [Solobacterium sp.]
MLKRKIMDQLIKWKESKEKKCLLLYGARQVGKTYIVDQFAKDHYDSYISIDFRKYPSLKSIFEGDLDVDTLISKISLFLPQSRFIPNNTLLLLDEIQDCPPARTSLKYWAQDDRFDVIATGSQLGVSMHGNAVPAGYETKMMMHSLDFEEFLWAMGIPESSISMIYSYFISGEKIPEEINEKMFSYLRQYMVIGGMPDVINQFLKTNNYAVADELQNQLNMEYRDDIAKYADSSIRMKAIACYDSIPQQLLKDNHKFQYKMVKKGTTSSYYEKSFEWLEKAGLLTRCYNVEIPEFPLSGYKKSDQFTVYLNDIGLLSAFYGFQNKAPLLQNTLVGNVKGALYENLIADILLKKNHPLYYYANEKRTVQIEFLLEENSHVVPMEVKAKNRATPSLNKLLLSDHIPYGYKMISGNTGFEGKKKTLPLYMAMFL